MVIKKAPKTKAFQKTACLKNWKKFSRNVLNQLKEHKCTGVQLLDLWQNKDKKVIKHKKEKKEYNWSNFLNQQKTVPAIQVQAKNTKDAKDTKDTKNEKAPPKADLFGMKKLSGETKAAEVKMTEIKPSTSSSSASSSSSSSNSRVNSASVTSQLQSSSSNNLSTTATSGALVITRNTQKKTFFPNQTSKIYPVVTTSASSVNPEVIDNSDDETIRNIELGGDATKKSTSGSSMRRPIYPRFPLLIQSELSDLDLKNNDSGSEVSSVVDDDDSKKKVK